MGNQLCAYSGRLQCVLSVGSTGRQGCACSVLSCIETDGESII